jgi:hypothetical protein
VTGEWFYHPDRQVPPQTGRRGVWISNVNVLTDDDLDHCDKALGSWPLKTLQCKVYKVKRYETGAPLPL